MTGFSMSDFNSTCAEIFNTIREIKKSLASQDIQRGLVPWFNEFTGETTEEGLKNGLSRDTVVPHGDTHTSSTEHDVAGVFVDVAAHHGSMDAYPFDPICLESPEFEPKGVEFAEKETVVEMSAACNGMSFDVEETSDSILRPSKIRFDLKSDAVITTIVRALPGLRPTVSVNFSDHCYFFLNSNMSVAGKKGENCSDIHICAFKCLLSSCLQPACENVKTSLPVYLPTAWSLFTSEYGFFCFKKMKFKYFEPGEPPPLPLDITKYFITYKGTLTDVCDNINWCWELADFIIIWSFSIQSMHNDMKLWSFKVILGSDIKLMILVHYIGEEKQFAYKNITSIVLIKMEELTEVYHCISVRNPLDIVTAYFNGSRRQLTKNDRVIVGLNAVMINEPTTTVMVYGVNKKATSVGENNILILYLGGGNVSLITIEESILELKDTADDIHISGEDYDSKMINHFYPELGEYNIIENLKVQQHITDFDRANKYISSTTQTTIEVDTVTDIQGVVIVVYTWPKNYGDPSKRKDLSTLRRGAATLISSDEKVVLREVAQSLFEGSIYTFELLQTILSPIDKEIPCLAKYMLAYVMGGSLVSRLTAHSTTQVKCLVNIIILLFGDLGHGKPTTIKHIVISLEIVEVPNMYHHSRYWVLLNFSSSVKAGVDLCEGSGYLEWINSIVLGLQVWLNNENVKGLNVSYFQATHDIIGSASYKPPPTIQRLSSIHNCDLLIHLCGHFSPLITKLGSEKMVTLSAMSVASSLTTSGSKRMQAGDSKFADLGGVTYDPKRWNVFLHSEDMSSTLVADDGLTAVQEVTNNLAGNVTIIIVTLIGGLITVGVNVVAVSANRVLTVRRIENMTKALVAKLGLIFKKVDSELADVAAVSASNKYKVGNMIEEVMPMVGCKGVLTLAFSMHCTKKFVMFSLPRPPEIANLEDKVDFKGVGMIRAWKVK